MSGYTRSYLNSPEQINIAVTDLKSRIKIYILSQTLELTPKNRIFAKINAEIDALIDKIEDEAESKYYKNELTAFAKECYVKVISVRGVIPPIFFAMAVLDTVKDNNVIKSEIAASKGKISRAELYSRGGYTNATAADKYYREVKREIEAFIEEYTELSESERYSTAVNPRNIAEMKLRRERYLSDRKELDGAGTKIVYVPPHANCSRRCQAYQGRLYSLDGTRGEIDGKPYVPIEEASDDVTYTTRAGKTYPAGLFSFNCRHTIVPYESGMVVETIPDEVIEERRSAEEKQRKMERAIRREREKAAIYGTIGKQGGDKEVKKLSARHRRRVAQMRREYEAFSKEHELAYYPERIIQPKNAERSGKISAGVNHTPFAAASREVSLEAVQSGEINVNSLTEAEKRDILKKAIDSGQITTKLNHEKQAPHIFGSEMYDPKRNKSYFTISEGELQTLVNERMGTGEIHINENGEIREVIQIDRDIGFCVKKDGSEKRITNRFTIHYSKKRTHIVPSNGKR